MRELLLIIEERVAIQTYVAVVDALVPESITHPLAEHGGGHQWHDVLETSGELEHDDDQRDRHASHSACAQMNELAIKL